MKKTYPLYRVNTNSSSLLMPHICSVCGDKSEEVFTVKGKTTMPAVGLHPRVKRIKVKFPICKSCNRKRKNSILVAMIYYLVSGLVMSSLLPFVARNQEDGIYIFLWLLFPVITGVLWTFVISPAFINNGIALHEFIYKDFQDIPKSIEIIDSNLYKFGNVIFAEAFAKCNSTFVKTVMVTENKHLVWRIIISVASTICSALALFIVYALIKGII